ncbi:MAG: MraZ N-terminal domain-containing protein [Acidimicrobiales bacterium]
MKPPSGVRVKVDAQGRMVLPRRLREEIVDAPGEVTVRRTPDGLLLSPAESTATVSEGSDGLPLLRMGRPVTNAQVLAAIDRDRSER